eukprot:TRINITY_DN26847_c0_g6_i1.p2 TRINITY_DN26847_c0_g6~~TRINITY_DN26847_c0_g6_i1.p2  ORF type:complete len:172 (-),score=29.30 TRINITY_DN26847_c0_g6_i1:139-654(-)
MAPCAPRIKPLEAPSDVDMVPEFQLPASNVDLHEPLEADRVWMLSSMNHREAPAGECVLGAIRSLMQERRAAEVSSAEGPSAGSWGLKFPERGGLRTPWAPRLGPKGCPVPLDFISTLLLPESGLQPCGLQAILGSLGGTKSCFGAPGKLALVEAPFWVRALTTELLIGAA